MAGVPIPEYEKYWQSERQSLREQYKNLIQAYPDAESSIPREYKTINDITALAGCTPASVGNSKSWNDIADNAKNDKAALRGVLRGKRLFSALCGIYSVALCEFKQVLQASAKQTRSTEEQKDRLPEFTEQKRRKRRNSSDQDSKKKAAMSPAPHLKAQVPTRNFFSPLRMETGNDVATREPADQAEEQGQETTSKAGRPPPIVLTSTVNLMSLQKELKVPIIKRLLPIQKYKGRNKNSV
jgi:hypothetical protein